MKPKRKVYRCEVCGAPLKPMVLRKDVGMQCGECKAEALGWRRDSADPWDLALGGGAVKRSGDESLRQCWTCGDFDDPFFMGPEPAPETLGNCAGGNCNHIRRGDVWVNAEDGPHRCWIPQEAG
jgi:DNA-directed RNA polymerase subunit RPC12/RpoP